MQHRQIRSGFTIVELLVIIVVIALLAAISISSYGSWQKRNAESLVKSDIIQASTSMKSARNFSTNGTFPSTLPFKSSATVTITTNVAGNGSGYCVIGQSTKIASVNFYMNSQSTDPQPGTSCTVS